MKVVVSHFSISLYVPKYFEENHEKDAGGAGLWAEN
jgi:hypothetical protein